MRYIDQRVAREAQRAETQELRRELLVEPWTLATLENGWTNNDTVNYYAAAFCRDPLGWVRIRGLVQCFGTGNIVAGRHLFVLPVGYRPTRIANFAAIAGNQDARVVVYPSGLVQCPAASSPFAELFLTLDGIHFDTR